MGEGKIDYEITERNARSIFNAHAHDGRIISYVVLLLSRDKLEY